MEFLYGYHRLLESKKDIMDYDPSTNLEDPPYEFPKGKSKPKEDSIDVATREFQEEIGYKLRGNVHPFPIEHHVKGISGRNYKMKCWICEISQEINLEDVNKDENIEIEHRAWLNVNESNMAEKFPTVSTSENKKVNITSETLELIIKSESVINLKN